MDNNQQQQETHPEASELIPRELRSLSAELDFMSRELRDKAQQMRERARGSQSEWVSNRVAITLEQIAADLWWCQLTPDAPNESIKRAMEHMH